VWSLRHWNAGASGWSLHLHSRSVDLDPPRTGLSRPVRRSSGSPRAQAPPEPLSRGSNGRPPVAQRGCRQPVCCPSCCPSCCTQQDPHGNSTSHITFRLAFLRSSCREEGKMGFTHRTRKCPMNFFFQKLPCERPEVHNLDGREMMPYTRPPSAVTSRQSG
jgi:hypothetical protein